MTLELLATFDFNLLWISCTKMKWDSTFQLKLRSPSRLGLATILILCKNSGTYLHILIKQNNKDFLKLLIDTHSSQFQVLHLTKASSEVQKNPLYSCYFFHFSLCLFSFPSECPALCRRDHSHKYISDMRRMSKTLASP